MRSTSFSRWCSTCDPSGRVLSGFPCVAHRPAIRNRMFPACSLLFSRPGRITSTFRPSLSVPATYCFPVAPSAATSRHRMRSGRVLARHRAVAENIFSAFFRFQARAREYRHRRASLAKRLRSLVPRKARVLPRRLLHERAELAQALQLRGRRRRVVRVGAARGEKAREGAGRARRVGDRSSGAPAAPAPALEGAGVAGRRVGGVIPRLASGRNPDTSASTESSRSARAVTGAARAGVAGVAGGGEVFSAAARFVPAESALVIARASAKRPIRTTTAHTAKTAPTAVSTSSGHALSVSTNNTVTGATSTCARFAIGSGGSTGPPTPRGVPVDLIGSNPNDFLFSPRVHSADRALTGDRWNSTGDPLSVRGIRLLSEKLPGSRRTPNRPPTRIGADCKPTHLPGARLAKVERNSAVGAAPT